MATLSNLQERFDPFFTGRESALVEVRAALMDQRACVVQGPTGIGKTRLATEYARRHAEGYSTVWLLRCDQPSSLNAGLAGLAERLGINPDAPSAALRADIRRLLGMEEDWLLILDNPTGPKDIVELLPTNRQGHVLITAAQGNWASFAPGLVLPPLPRVEAAALLRGRAGRPDDPDADTLAKALGDLPIALEQAAALAAASQLSFAHYLRRFEDLWAELLQSGQQIANYPGPIAMAWELAYRQVGDEAPTAADFLALCSFLSTDDISLSFLRRGAQFAAPALKPALSDALEFEATADLLTRYALLERDERAVHLHRATASLARNRLSDEKRNELVQTAFRMARDAFDYRPADSSSRHRAAEVLPHLLAATDHAEALDLDTVAVAKSLDDAGRFLFDSGHFDRARDVFQRAFNLAKNAYGEGHPRLAGLASNLARALARAGELEEAREHFEKAIALDSAAFGYNDPRVAASVNNYGRYHYARRDFNTARQQFEWARGVIENYYGPEHQRVAAVINNIGYTHGSAGQIAEARQYLEQALIMANKTYPAGHPDVARISANLGRVLQAQDDFVGARELLEKALLLDRAAQGHEHPAVARDLVYLGDLTLEAGDAAMAEGYYRQAMHTAESAYGLYHPAVLSCLEKLESARRATGDTDGARWCAERIAALRGALGAGAVATAG